MRDLPASVKRRLHTETVVGESVKRIWPFVAFDQKRRTSSNSDAVRARSEPMLNVALDFERNVKVQVFQPRTGANHDVGCALDCLLRGNVRAEFRYRAVPLRDLQMRLDSCFRNDEAAVRFIHGAFALAYGKHRKTLSNLHRTELLNRESILGGALKRAGNDFAAIVADHQKAGQV